jgi:hypothetical protein
MKKEQNKKLRERRLKLKSKKQRGQCCTLPVMRERDKKSNDYR